MTVSAEFAYHAPWTLTGWSQRLVRNMTVQAVAYGGEGVRGGNYVAMQDLEILAPQAGITYDTPSGLYGETVVVTTQVLRAGVVVETWPVTFTPANNMRTSTRTSSSIKVKTLDTIRVTAQYTVLPSNPTVVSWLDVSFTVRSTEPAAATGYAAYEGPTPASGFVGSGCGFSHELPTLPTSITIVPIDTSNVGDLLAYSASRRGVGVYAQPLNGAAETTYFYAHVIAL